MIVADGSGNSGLLNSASFGFSAVKMSSAGRWWGAGFAAGPSVLLSYNPISKVAGPSGSFSAGGGATLGAGISISTSGAATISLVWVRARRRAFPLNYGSSQFIPFCKE
jgi:hypothetical protein